MYERELKRRSERLYAVTNEFSREDDDDTIQENMKRICNAIAPYIYSLMIYSDVIALEFCLNRFDWNIRTDLHIDDYLTTFKELRQELHFPLFPLDLILENYINRRHHDEKTDDNEKMSWKEQRQELRKKLEADYFGTIKEMLHSRQIEAEKQKQEEAKEKAEQERFKQISSEALPYPEDEIMLTINQVEAFIYTLADKEYLKFGKHYYTKKNTVLQPYPEIQ